MAVKFKQTLLCGFILTGLAICVPAFGKLEVDRTSGAQLQKVWSRWAKVLAQAQSIEREAWWVLTDQRSKSKPGSFSRLLRALEKKNKSIKKNKVLSCEQFEVRGETLDPVKGIMKGKLFEACRKPAVLILDFESTRPNALQLTIYPEFQVDVYGLGASLFNKKIECVLGWNEKAILSNLKCKSYKRNRNDKEIVELETFEYQKDSKNLLTLKGQITEGFVALRKIETQVPLSGAITVNETELDRPTPPGLIEVSVPKPAPMPMPVPVPKPVAPEVTELPQENQRKAIDPALKEFTPPVAEGIVSPEAAPPVAPPGALSEADADENPHVHPVIKQSEPEMIESSDKPQGR